MSAEAGAAKLAGVPGLGGLYARGIARSLAAAAARRRTVRPADLPTTRLRVTGVRADAEHLTAYQRLVGEPATDALPAGFVHVLAFPIATALMVRDDFPLPLLGMVHLANRVEQRRPVLLGEALTITVGARDLRSHRSGVSVDLVAEVTSDRDPSAVVWRGVSTYLAKGYRLTAPSTSTPVSEPRDSRGSRGSDDSEGGAGSDGGSAGREFVAPVPTGQWRLGTDVGRRYATVSGDRNPIHLSSLTARAFGFPRTIAHGMYTAARALADVGPGARGDAFVWEVEFGKPVLLPSTVAVRVAPVAHDGPTTAPAAARTNPAYEYVVWARGARRASVSGSVSPSDPNDPVGRLRP